MNTRHVDATGTLCPVPILLTARAIAGIEVGAQLEVVGNDPGMLEDMPAWCQETGHRLVSMEESGGEIRCLVQKIGADGGDRAGSKGPGSTA